MLVPGFTVLPGLANCGMYLARDFGQEKKITARK